MTARPLREKLSELQPAIAQLLESSGAPGLSIGVLGGDDVFTAHHGRRESVSPTPPNDDTLYNIASLTKLITAMTVSALVTDGILNWDRPIREYVPGFRRDDELGRKATLVDLLSNRTGLADGEKYWGKMGGEWLIEKEQVIERPSEIEAARPFRKAFPYSQWNYALIVAVVEKVTGKLFGTCAKQSVFDPLGMKRSTLNWPTVDNVVGMHVCHADGSPCPTPKDPNYSTDDTTALASAFGARSSIAELLIFYRAVMRAYNHQVQNQTDTTPDSPLTHLRKIFSPHIGIRDGSIDTFGYGFGIYRSVLPMNLSATSINNVLLTGKYRPKTKIGSTHAGTEVLHHNGTMPGFFANIVLLPSLQSAVLVCVNALPLYDVTVPVSQLLLGSLLNEPQQPQDLIEIGRLARKASLDFYPRIYAMLLKSKAPDPTPALPLYLYCGRYYNATGSVYWRVDHCGAKLRLGFMDKPMTRLMLEPWSGNTFCWPPDWEQHVCELRIFPFLPPGERFVEFMVERGRVGGLSWNHDYTVRKPEVFRRGEGGDVDKVRVRRERL